jgi:hypothetical protein
MKIIRRTHSKHTLTPEYVVGLVDGEGSFTVYIRNPDEVKTVSRRVAVEPKFYLKLIEKDKEILYALQSFFGCGSVYFQKDSRPRHQNCYRFEVFRWEDLHTVIIPFFLKHEPRFTSKQNDFRIFVKIMSALKNNEHKTKQGLRALFELKQQMH